MRIASTQYNLNHKAFEIYISGCDGLCLNCHNPELQNYDIGEPYTSELGIILSQKINKFNNMIDQVWILGGEPLLQNNYTLLINLLNRIKTDTNKKIMLWTRFELEEINVEICNLCDFIKTGKYEESLKTESNFQHGINLISSNQKIYRRNENGEFNAD